MGQPFLSDGVDFGDVVMAIIMGVIALVICLLVTVFMVWYERKVVARLQNRIGPNIAGPKGLLQTLADGTKLFMKEDLIPTKADRFVFQLAPYLSVIPAFLVFSLIPIAGDFSDGNNGSSTIAGREFYWQLADVPVGILFLLAMSSIALYGVMLAGWASGSKYPLLGSIRATAQAISYEAALGLALVAVILVTGSLSTHGIVAAQAGSWGVNWNLVATGVIPFVVFLIAATAELNRPPFDLVEAEQELVGGYHTEYSSIRFGLFYVAEFMNTVTMSGIIVTLFLGGPTPWFDIPFINALGAFGGLLWFIVKLQLFLFTFVWIRSTLPRLRYDQLMDLGWKVLIPLSLGWLLVLAGIRIARDGNLGLTDDSIADTLVVIIASIVGLAIGGLLLLQANRNARDEQLEAAGLSVVPTRTTDPVSPTTGGDH